MDYYCPFCGCGGLVWVDSFYLCVECRSAISESLVDEEVLIWVILLA